MTHAGGRTSVVHHVASQAGVMVAHGGVIFLLEGGLPFQVTFLFERPIGPGQEEAPAEPGLLEGELVLVLRLDVAPAGNVSFFSVRLSGSLSVRQGQFINPATENVVFRATDQHQIKAQLADKGSSLGKSSNTEIALICSP